MGRLLVLVGVVVAARALSRRWARMQRPSCFQALLRRAGIGFRLFAIAAGVFVAVGRIWRTVVGLVG